MAARLDLDALTPAAIAAGAVAGLPVTVLGLARTGTALARFFVDAGARVTVYDGQPTEALGPAIDALEGRPVTLACGPEADPAMAWAGAALVAFSPTITPGFPTTEPRLRAALADLAARASSGAPDAPVLASEPDLFLRLCPAPTVGVTGTKGKTTTASLAAHLLAEDTDHPVVLGGNIGTPLVDRLGGLTRDHRVVIELSELQLPSLSRGTTVAAYTNVTADHLDRHGSVAGYRAVKRRLADLVAAGGAVVLNADDAVVGAYAVPASVRAVRYGLGEPAAGGLGVVDGWVVSADVERLGLAGGGRAATGPRGRVLPLAELPLPGRHNQSNLLAAVAVALLFGVAPDAIRRAAAGFAGVEHRLEVVAEIDGVRFVNDSQGTQPEAVMAALRSFDPPLVLIAGGRAKGIDLASLGPVAAERAAAAVLIGESGPDLADLLRGAGMDRVEQAGTLDAALPRADAIARELLASAPAASVATVLLSPAAASFDQFVDYAARGRAFREGVAAIAAARPTAARR